MKFDRKSPINSISMASWTLTPLPSNGKKQIPSWAVEDVIRYVVSEHPELEYLADTFFRRHVSF